MRRLKITRLVKHVIRGQQHLPLLEKNLAVRNQRRANSPPASRYRPAPAPHTPPATATVSASPAVPAPSGCAPRTQAAPPDPAADIRTGTARKKRPRPHRASSLRKPSSTMRAELPSKSPTVGLNCASAIFIYNPAYVRRPSFSICRLATRFLTRTLPPRCSRHVVPGDVFPRSHSPLQERILLPLLANRSRLTVPRKHHHLIRQHQ